jgi:hypothetical protein
MKGVFTINLMVDSIIYQFNSQLRATGFSQAYRLDYGAIFIPTVRINISQLFLPIVDFEALEYYHFDIKNSSTESKSKMTIFF